MSDPWDKPAGKAAGNSLDQAQVMLERIQAFVKRLRALAEEIGTESDTNELRDRLHEGRKKTSALAKATTDLLKQPAADKIRSDKLKRTLQTTVSEFEKMSREHQQQEKEILVQMEQQYSQSYGHNPEFGSYQEEPETRGRGRTKLQLELADGMEDVDVKIIQERNEEVRKLDEELGEVVDLVQEVQEMTYDQGEKLDQAAEKVKMSEETVADAEKELSRFYRCCGCCCCVKARKR